MSSSWSNLIQGMGASAVPWAVLVLALMGLAQVILRWWVRRRMHVAAQVRGPGGQWMMQALQALVPPLALLAWIHALHLAASLLLRSAGSAPFAAGAASALTWAWGLGVVGALAWFLVRAGRLIEAFFASLSTRTSAGWDDVLLPLAGRAIRIGLPLLALAAATPLLPASPGMTTLVNSGTSLALIGIVGFLLFQVVDATAAFVLRQHRIDVGDNLQARSIYTQVVMLKKVAVITIAIFTLASMLMVFDSVRQFGTSILASAGVAGIVVGFAAQRSIATLLAGFQIALTQPIRVDDVVIVENEWGRIEDVTLTYVVVRIWDLRRLIVPITYFIEQPFQNWTRSSADILATVFLYVDYTVPVEALRGELTRILEASPLWDRKVNVLQVTDATDRALQLRALASAGDASRAWDLRCEIRERLIAFVQREYPDSLPRLRAVFAAEPSEPFSTPPEPIAGYAR